MEFSCALGAGMTDAAIVTEIHGRAQPCPGRASHCCKILELLERGGYARGRREFHDRLRRRVGDVVVDHARTRFVASTASKDWVAIIERAARRNRASFGSNGSSLKWVAKTNHRG